MNSQRYIKRRGTICSTDPPLSMVGACVRDDQGCVLVYPHSTPHPISLSVGIPNQADHASLSAALSTGSKKNIVLTKMYRQRENHAQDRRCIGSGSVLEGNGIIGNK